MEECHIFISLRRERRHKNTLERQTKKFNQLWQRNTGGHSNYQYGGEGYLEEVTRETRYYNTETNQTNTETASTPGTIKESSMTRKWVQNLSKTPLTEDQQNILARGPNFAIVAEEPPAGEYISQVERMCQQLKQGKVEELRGETKSILKNIQPPRPNISKEEANVIQELKRDKEKIILTTHNGVSMVLLDKEDYIKKSEDLLKQNTYRELVVEPTNKYKNKLINLLKTIKSEGGMNNNTYKRLYTTGAVSPKYYGLPKIHEAGVPLRPIISSRGSATYETAKELAKIIKPLVGRSPLPCTEQQGLLKKLIFSGTELLIH